MQKKLFLAMSALLIIVILAMGYIAYTSGREMSNRQVDAQLSNLCFVVEAALEREKPADVQAFAQDFAANGHVRVTILNASGDVLADTEVDASSLENHLQRPEIRSAIAGGSGVAQRFSTTRRETMRYFAHRAQSGEIIRLSVPVEALWNYQSDVAVYILYAAIAAIALSLLFTWMLTRSVVGPVERWTAWAQTVARDPSSPPPAPLGAKSISESMQHLGMRLNEAVTDLSSANSRMDAILSGMASGLIAVDKSRRITFVNRQALKLFGIRKNPEGLDVVTATQKGEIGRLLVDGGTVEFRQNGRAMVASVTHLESLSLIWLNDISDVRALDAQRREFAANVSHELKTPLAAIQGSVDALRLDACDKDEGLSRIEGEVKWLKALTADLLDLTRVENMLSESDGESFPIEDLLGDIQRSLKAACAQKDVTFAVEAQPITVHANYTRLRQLAGNLCANAVQYNKPGGSVNVIARQEGKNLVLSVADTGIGIPERERERIFERFYRVDKARSRDSGSTGLGLSIVKHIARLYGGRIDIRSGDGGSTFTATLPIAEEDPDAQNTL